jgi:predicted Zn-dependent protease
LGWSKRQIQLPAGRYETILPPSAVADLMLYMVWSMDARPAHEGRSAFALPGKGPGATRLGEQLTELPLTLSSDPSASGLQTAPFLVTTASSDSASVFDNGAPVHRVDWLRNGTINALTYPRAAAQDFGAQFTPPAENLILVGDRGERTDELVARTERGLLLTCLWYIREVDPVSLLLTGLTRDGVYLVEGGEVVGQVNNFRFNESPIDLIRRVTEIGATERTLCREWKDWFSRTAMAPLRIPDFNMSSVSQAS